ncbi:3-dehydroquinate dehydratase [Raineyella antarctica]|uniref:3-dehydroquinate dehydratase n=1 Tax=Raineyella antarctica TaxID=1577474 RepID=A0A1G6GIM3_9ACTN|nr:type II 3-dehydroquinate dehydratase [Raineyella antarctica]SDB81862.1 3-dehydroquinate dehydratase [Raineyella antarctica]
MVRTSNDGKRWRIGVIDGPNMSFIGREKGARHHNLQSWDELRDLVAATGDRLGVEILHTVSNYEGRILEWIHAEGPGLDGLLVNPGGLTTYGEGLRHALEENGTPYVEVHLFNPVQYYASVSPHIRLESRLTSSAQGVVAGFGEHGYVAALVGLVSYLDGFSEADPVEETEGADAAGHTEGAGHAEPAEGAGR